MGEDKGYVYLPFEQHEILKNLKALYKKLLSNGESPKDILILTAYNKGDYGTININNLIQPLVNKNYGSKSKVSCGEVDYYLGDLVIQCVNNYKAKIYNENDRFLEYEELTFIPNGEIVEIQNGNVIIQFDTERVIYSKEDILNLKLAARPLCKENGDLQKPPFFGAMPVCGIAKSRQTYGFFLFRLCGG